MDKTIIAAIIAASVAAITGVANIVLTIHKNKQESIVAYRMKWVEEIREEFSKVLSWIYYTQNNNDQIMFNCINELRTSVYKISLMLNISDDYDNEIRKKLFEYLNEVKRAYEIYHSKGLSNEPFYQWYVVSECSGSFKKSEKIKKELEKLIGVYLKTEWTRVKAESSMCKIKYKFCWNIFKGFQSDKAIEKFTKEYNG